MWLKETSGNIYDKESGTHSLNFLGQDRNIYVMDNHLAAGWCWLNSLNPNEQYNFFHVDQHQDLCGGLATRDVLDKIKGQYPFGIDRYCNFTFERGISTPQFPYNKVFFVKTRIYSWQLLKSKLNLLQ